MVEVRYRGSPGDNIFQYCFGRLLAERWGWELQALPLPWFPATAERVAGRRFLSPLLSWSGMAAEERQLGVLLRPKDMLQPLPARLVLYGWFHRWEYYAAHREAIRRWLQTRPPSRPADPGDFAVCLRARRPESWDEPGIHPGHAPPWKQPVPSPESVAALLERLSFDRLFILTDDPHGEAVRPMERFKPVVMNIDSMGAWHWLRTCRRMVVNVCHASDWWAAWLSGAQEIYAIDPWPSHKPADCNGPYGCGWLRGRPLARPNLRVPEPRWKYDW
jgi:hypothetical protein